MIEIKDYTPKCFPHIVGKKYGGYAVLAAILGRQQWMQEQQVVVAQNAQINKELFLNAKES
jgi:hypothetical protein